MTPPAPSVTRRDACEALLLGLLVVSLFHFFGNASSAAMESRSVFRWIAGQWRTQAGDFAHGWLMPLVSAWFVWRARHELAACPKRVDRRGLAVLAGALALHWAAYRAQQPRISLVALAGVLWALPFYLLGPCVARRLLFPAGYLLLCFISSLLSLATFRLRLLSSAIASGLLNGIGIDAVRKGTAIYSAAGGGFQFDVADPCSGLRSLFVMLALAAPYAYAQRGPPARRWTLFVLSLPLAVAGNALRIVTVAIVAQAFGQEAAMRVYHDYSGYLMFALTVLLLTSTASVLDRLWRRPARAAPRPEKEVPCGRAP